MGHSAARRRDDVVEIQWQGHLHGDDVGLLTARVAELLAGARFVIADARAIQSFDAGARQRSIELLALYREHGVERLITLTTSPILRMAGAAVALVCRMPLDFTETPEQAEQIVRAQRANPCPARSVQL